LSAAHAEAKAGVVSPMARGLAAEFRRAAGDVMLWAFLPVALLPALVLLAALPPDLRSAPVGAVGEIGKGIGESLVSNVLVIVAIMGAIGVTTAQRTGVLPRELIFSSWPIVLGCRALSSTVSALLLGAVSVGVMEVTFLAMTGQPIFSLPVALSTVAVTGSAGLWGFLLGVLIRNPLLVLFVVPATLIPALAIADAAPAVADFLPLRAQMAATGLAQTGADAGAATAVLLAWLTALGAVVALVLRRQDRL